MTTTTTTRKRQRSTRRATAEDTDASEAQTTSRRIVTRNRRTNGNNNNNSDDKKISSARTTAATTGGRRRRREKKEEEEVFDVPVPARKKARRRRTLSQDTEAQRRVMKDLETLREKHREQEEEEKHAIAVATEEKRKMKKKPSVMEVERTWQGWKRIFFVGTEWSNYDLIFSVQWDFDHLETQLFEDESMKGKKVFLFGATEPQAIDGDIYFIPVIVAVVGDMLPPKKLGIKSVQMEKEEIISMEDMKMGWTPVEPKLGRIQGVNDIYMLHCNTRRAALARMKEEDVKKYEYCLPYFFRPRDALSSTDYPTDVTGMCTIGGHGVSFDFDWEMDDLDEYVDEQCEAHEITKEEDKKTLREAIREAVRAAKKSIKEEKEKKKAEIDAIPLDQQKAMNEAQFFKFYPQNKDPDLEAHNLKSPFINRYYGRATKLF